LAVIDSKIQKYQKEIIEAYAHIYEGPNADNFTGKKYRVSNSDIHFNHHGSQKLAQEWAKKIINSKGKNNTQYIAIE
jgi:hypothetical protein